jgi:ribosomal protein L32
VPAVLAATAVVVDPTKGEKARANRTIQTRSLFQRSSREHLNLMTPVSQGSLMVSSIVGVRSATNGVNTALTSAPSRTRRRRRRTITTALDQTEAELWLRPTW